MNIKNMMKFLFPEYQIIESMREYGFILWKKKSEKYSNLSVTKLDGNIINNSTTLTNEKIYTGYTSEDNRISKYKGERIINKDRIDERFKEVKSDVSREIVGQKYFIENLILAFKRPFITGYNGYKPKNTIFVIGERSSGRKTIIESVVKALHSKKLLKTDIISTIDLSFYPTKSERELFLSDLYKVLYSDSQIVVFDSFDKCNDNFLEILSQLVINGRYRLNARYALQNDSLVEVANVLMKNSVDEISSNGKYFVFITDKDESKIVDVFGTRFIASIGDMIKMDTYTTDEINEIIDKFIREVRTLCNNNLSIVVKNDNSLVEHFVDKYSNGLGFAGIREYI